MKFFFNIIILIFISFQFSGCDLSSIFLSQTEEEMKKQIEILQKRIDEQDSKIKEYEKIIKNNDKKVNEMFN